MDDLQLLTSVYQVLSWSDCLSDLLCILCESDLPFISQPHPPLSTATTEDNNNNNNDNNNLKDMEEEKEKDWMEIEVIPPSEQTAFSLPLFLEEVLELCLHTCSSPSLHSIVHYLFTIIDDPFFLSSSSSSHARQDRLALAERILAVIDPDLQEGIQRVKEIEKQVGIRLETRFARATVMEIDQLLREIVNGNGYDVGLRKYEMR